ncbi:MAG: hypothetical protein ACYSU0_17050, partial [Planctomycetota bacterium]
MSGLEGRISVDFVPRWLENTDFEDQDLYATLLLRWGGPSDRRSGSIYWRGVRDLDGSPAGIPSADPFRSSYDYLGTDLSSQMYHLYYDLRASPGGSFVRLGRQFVYEGQPFHFDGGKFETKAGRGGLKASVFGGRPVRYYEVDAVTGATAIAKGIVAGAGVEMRPAPGIRVGGVFAHLKNEARMLGMPATEQVDNLVIARTGMRLSDWGSAVVRYTAVDGETRDVHVRTRAVMQRIDARIAVSFYAQPLELAETTVGLSPYQVVQFSSHPFRKTDASVFKDFRARGWRIGAGVRGTVRRLADAGDQQMYNRDYDVLWYGLELES